MADSPLFLPKNTAHPTRDHIDAALFGAESVPTNPPKRDIDAEIKSAVGGPSFKRPPSITIGSWWFAETWGINCVLDIRVSWCGDTEVRLSRAGWWDARSLRQAFDRYTAQPSPYSDKKAGRA